MSDRRHHSEPISTPTTEFFVIISQGLIQVRIHCDNRSLLGTKRGSNKRLNKGIKNGESRREKKITKQIRML